MFSYPAYREIAARPDLFEAVMAHQITAVGVRDAGATRRMLASLVSANYFDVLGRTPALGRTFTAEEDRPGADLPVVVVSHAFWRRAGQDAALLGGTIRVNERLFTVVGIAPPGFTGTSTLFGPELFFPLGVSDSLAGGFEGRSTQTLAQADNFALFLVGRLRPGASGGPGAAPRSSAWPRRSERRFRSSTRSGNCRPAPCRGSARPPSPRTRRHSRPCRCSSSA